MFSPTTAQQFNAEIYGIIQHASYMFQPFSAIIREVFDKEKEKFNVANYDFFSLSDISLMMIEKCQNM
jgi:hypothetical protein